MAIHRDTQGPCPNGFHVGTKDEWQKIYDILTVTFGLSQTYGTPRTYLKMPTPTGLSSTTGGVVSSSKTSGYYWTATTIPGNDARVYVVSFTSSTFVITDYAKSNGMSVRPVADTAVVPDSSRTVLYDGSEYATGTSIYDPGVYYNSTLGLVSLSDDGVDWISIADKNVGATEVYSSSTSEATSGGFFQRGNNHMFPYTGATSFTSSIKVNASEYGPGNYYDRGTFIIVASSSTELDWASPSNNNLWGGVTNGTWEDPPILTYHGHIGTWHAIGHRDTQGPCQNGFHIPTQSEFQALINAGVSMGSWSASSGNIASYLKLPLAGEIDYDHGDIPTNPTAGYYRTSTAEGNNYAYRFIVGDDTGFVLNSRGRGYASSIRPFKDEPVDPMLDEILKEGRTFIDGNPFWREVIARNESLGIISILYDEGRNCITIADKNLGATVVYSSGNVTQANSGGLFQWGNNYEHTRTSTLSRSSTRVNASDYGPENYYSSSVFIELSNWDSSNNNNLWGGVTNGMRYEVK